MRTGTLTFANFVLIFQVVSGVYSSFPEKSQIYMQNDFNDLKGAALNDGMKEKELQFLNDIKNPHSFNNLDDIYESQLPPPPTQEDMSGDTSLEEIIENSIQSKPDDSTPIDSNVLSGAGQLETNEIIKDPNAVLMKTSLPTSKSNIEDNQPKINSQAPVATKQYSYPELDKAIEMAMKNLPPANESPLVPFIKAFNEKIQQQTANENANQGDDEMKTRLNKRILLKLAKRVQKEKEEKDSQVQHFNINESQVQEQKEEKSTQDETLNDANEENQPCDCEGRCEGEMPLEQAESDQNSTPNQDKLSVDDEQGDGYSNPKILAHLIVTIRKPKTEDDESTQAHSPMVFSPLMQEPSPFGHREDPSLAHMFLRITKSKSILSNTIPPFSSENHEGNSLPEEPSIQGDVNPSTPISFRIYRKQLITRKPLDGYEDEKDQENSRTSFSRFLPNENDHESDIPDMKRIQYGQPMPRELLLIKHLHDIMKAKAAANALREIQERQLPKSFSSPSYEESTNTPYLSDPRLVIIRLKSELPEPQLPPRHFPDESSGYQIIHLNSHDLPSFKGLNEHELDSESVLSAPPQASKNIQKVTQSQDFGDQSNYNSPQDIPWFIKNILATLSRPTGEGHFQPISTQFTPVQKPSEERNPVLLRALFSPFAL